FAEPKPPRSPCPGTFLSRHAPLQHDPVEIPRLRMVVITVCLVQQTSIVPKRQVARAPLMPILESRLRRMCQQFIQQRQRYLVIQPKDPLDADRIDVDALASSVWM